MDLASLPCLSGTQAVPTDSGGEGCSRGEAVPFTCLTSPYGSELAQSVSAVS